MGRDEYWMQLALEQAQMALTAGEVPVGAVLVCADKCLAVGHNSPICSNDPTAHAEIVAMRAAAKQRGNYRLEDCELYVTLEPCSMCAGAILQARLKRVIYAALDPKAGAIGSQHNLLALPALNHQTQWSGGILAEPSAALLQGFFRAKRLRQRQQQAGRALRDDALRTPEQYFSELSPAPATSHYVNDLASLKGLRLHYLDTGLVQPAQPDFLLLHGPQAWSRCWHEAIVQRRWVGRLICPDLIGFGRSDKPKKPAIHTLAWHAQILLELASSLDLGSLRLVAPGSQGRLIEELMRQPGTDGWRVARLR